MRPFSALVWLCLQIGCSSSAPPPAATPAPQAAAPPAPAAPAPAARPLYYDRALTDADLADRSLRELSLMRNSIFARAGHPFVKPWLHDYFSAQPWYQPTDKLDASKISPTDLQNADRITRAEAAITRAELLHRREALLPRQGSASWTPEDQIELGLLNAALREWAGSDATPRSERNPLEDPSVLEGQLTLAQVEHLSRRDLRILRNTIFARHGRTFKSEVLNSYFFDKPWYKPDPNYSDKVLTEVDQRNIKLIQSAEDRLGGALSEFEHQMEEGWFAGA